MKKAFVFLLFFVLMFNILKVNANEVSNEDVNNDVIELLDRTQTRYHYDYLGTLEYGEYYQEIYNQLDSILREYMVHDVSENIVLKVSDELNEIYSDYYEKYHSSDDENREEYYEKYRKIEQGFHFVAYAYKRDNPMMYFCRTLKCSISYEYGDGEENRRITLKLNYYFDVHYTYKERIDINQELCKKIKEYGSYADGITSEYTIARIFNKLICDNMYYAYDQNGKPDSSDPSHNILGFFLHGTGVCETYAYTFSLLMNYAGVECFYVCGNYTPGSTITHAWNIAKMNDGKWYWFDIDVNDDDEKGHEQTEFLCYVEDRYKLNDDYAGDYLFSYLSVPERAESDKYVEDWYTITHNDVLYEIWVDKLYVLDNPKQNIVPEKIEFKWKSFTVDCLHEELVEKENCKMCVKCLKMHTSVIQDRYVEATCTTDGLTIGKRCADCGYIFEPQEIIPKKGHNLTEWIVDIEPTKDYDGYRHKDCTVCGEIVESEFLPRLKGCKQKSNALYGYILITNFVYLIVFRKRK